MASNAQNPSHADPARRSGTASQASPEAARGLGGRLGRDAAALCHPTPRAFPGGGPALAIQNQRTKTNSRPVCHPKCCIRPRGRACLWALAARAHLPAGRAPSCSNDGIHPGPRAACVSRCQTAAVTGGGPAPAAGRGNREAGLWVPASQSIPFKSGSPSKYRPAIGQSIDGGVINKSRSHRAYAQQLVTTRLLDCLHDPVTRLSRLQRIHPSALSNCYPAITPPDFYERGVMPC